MTSNRPYLVRALYEWILDNQMTPHLLVDATHPQAAVPSRFIQDGKIVLNIAPTAVQALALGNERITFKARFGGVATGVEVPAAAVLGIYARENGHGIVFPDDESRTDESRPDDTRDPNEKSEAPQPARKRPMLKVVK
ncbi:MAG: ClpXP protease specificity-enhancing factor [Candidatus Thiosymbion ectosymbiont of Robbea hypermnestra]|nr:ClpXP protease specificity-enhancing factor [Candidatus Thiosymbion ectosymbiont of Robbea hypermnestra]